MGHQYKQHKKTSAKKKRNPLSVQVGELIWILRSIFHILLKSCFSLWGLFYLAQALDQQRRAKERGSEKLRLSRKRLTWRFSGTRHQVRFHHWRALHRPVLLDQKAVPFCKLRPVYQGQNSNERDSIKLSYSALVFAYLHRVCIKLLCKICKKSLSYTIFSTL